MNIRAAFIKTMLVELEFVVEIESHNILFVRENSRSRDCDVDFQNYMDIDQTQEVLCNSNKIPLFSLSID